MRIVNRPMQNALGPYGLAIGAGAGGLRCAFAWQWVDSLPAVARGEKPGLFGANGEMAGSIRMRLCRRGVTVDELAQYYEQLGVSQPNLDRIADAIRRSLAANIGPEPGGATTLVTPGAAVGGGRVTASVDSLESSLLGSEPEAYEPRPAAPARRAPRRASKRAASAPAPTPAAAEPEAAPAPAPIPTAPADGRRYLGPVSDAGGSSYAQNAPAAGGGGAGFGTAINGLPAQALRGPSGARAITPYLGAQ
jgi:hypothetical protein